MPHSPYSLCSHRWAASACSGGPFAGIPHRALSASSLVLALLYPAWGWMKSSTTPRISLQAKEATSSSVKARPHLPGALCLGWGTPSGQPGSLTPGHPEEHPVPVGRATHLPAMTWDKRTQLWESFFPFRNKAFSISWFFAFFSCFWRLIYFLDHITYEA